MVERQWASPNDWLESVSYLEAGLDARIRWRLPVVLGGVLFARGRRTVTSWLRAAGITLGFQDYYYFLQSVGRKGKAISTRLLALVIRKIPLGDKIVLIIDDTPTKRYGPEVEGADIHHNPTPGPAGQGFLYGHVWVTISLLCDHPLWGTIGLPLQAMLYVRRVTLASIPRCRGWKFRTKLVLAADLLEWAVAMLKLTQKPVWVVIDGGYAKAPFLKRARRVATVVGRLRRDAALRDLPPPPRRGRPRRRGRPSKYGRHKISLAKRARQPRGWQEVECTVYGKRETKTVKTFLATYRPAQGVIRVVILRGDKTWIPLFCTDPEASVVEIIQGFAGRGTIEQDFHDVKEVWGTGQQQVRNIWANVGVFNINIWMHTLVELWAWNRPAEQLRDRSDSPWDDPDRRPSHADRRKALKRETLRAGLMRVCVDASLPRQIQSFVERLINLSA